MFKRILLVTIGLLVAGGAILWVYGRPAYRNYKERRSVAEAKEFLSRSDFNDASVAARKALLINSNDFDACVLMADLSERTRSPQVLEWRRRIVDLAPTLSNRLLLASACLRYQSPPYSIASQILDDLSGSAQDSAVYHMVAADLAMRLGNKSEATSQFQIAARLEPTNLIPQMNLSVLQLTSPDESVASAARASLEQMSANPQNGAAALRWLVEDCIRRNDLANADRFSRKLLADSSAGLPDQLDHLTILQQSKSPEFDGYLASVQRDSRTNAIAIYSVASWMLGHELVEEDRQWLTNCPAKLRDEQPVPFAFVDCYFARKDWIGLDSYLVNQKWRDLEFLRFAFLSRASEEAQQEMAADANWRSAIREANTQLGSLTTLLTMARNWKRVPAQEELLLQIGQYFRRERWALHELEGLYMTDGNTSGLNKLYAMRSEYDSTNYVAQNNLAATSLLLNVNLPHAYELAKGLYQSHPDDGIIVSTYAYSLQLQHHTKEGLAALEKLKPETLEQPPVALYYGVLLSADGESTKARPYLALAHKAQLLPEEKNLLTETSKTASDK